MLKSIYLLQVTRSVRKAPMLTPLAAAPRLLKPPATTQLLRQRRPSYVTTQLVTVTLQQSGTLPVANVCLGKNALKRRNETPF